MQLKHIKAFSATLILALLLQQKTCTARPLFRLGLQAVGGLAATYWVFTNDAARVWLILMPSESITFPIAAKILSCAYRKKIRIATNWYPGGGLYFEGKPRQRLHKISDFIINAHILAPLAGTFIVGAWLAGRLYDSYQEPREKIKNNIS